MMTSWASASVNLTLESVIEYEKENLSKIAKKNVLSKLVFVKLIEINLEGLRNNGRPLTNDLKKAVIDKFYSFKSNEEIATFCAHSQYIFSSPERISRLIDSAASQVTDSKVSERLSQAAREVKSFNIPSCGAGFRPIVLAEIDQYDFYDGVVDFYESQAEQMKSAISKYYEFNKLLEKIQNEY
jgi:hypothetical protein